MAIRHFFEALREIAQEDDLCLLLLPSEMDFITDLDIKVSGSPPGTLPLLTSFERGKILEIYGRIRKEVGNG